MNEPSDSSLRRRLLPVFLLVVAVVAVFGRVSRYEFLIWDDHWHVIENPHLNPVTCHGLWQLWRSPYWGLYIPLSYTFFAGEALIARQPLPDGEWGPNPSVFHLGNLALHVACVLLVFIILRRLFRRDEAAFAGALLFALHPVQVESVAWISETRGILCGLFSLLAVWQYLIHADTARTGRGAAGHYLAASACFLLALLSKPAAVAVPLVVAALDFGLLRRSVRRILWSVGPWVLLAVVWVVITKWQQPDRQLPFVAPIWARPLLAGDALAFYVVKLVAPLPLGPDYGRDPQWVMQSGTFYVAWLLPVGVLIGLACSRHRRIWLTAAAVSLACVLPVLGLMPFSFQRISTVADRYLYLALLGPALALSWLLAQRRPRWVLVAVAGCLGLAAFSFFQTGHWRDDDALLSHGLRVNPRSGIMRQLRGTLRVQEEKNTKAIDLCRAALEDHPQLVELYLCLATALSADGRVDEAVEEMRGAAERFPTDPLVHFKLAEVLAEMGAFTEAVEHYRETLRLAPGFTRAHMACGTLLLNHGQPGAAVEQFRSVLKIVPNHVPARVNLGNALQLLNRPEEARHHYLRAIEIRPNWPIAHCNLANLLRRQGASAEAVKHYRAALKADPDYAQAHVNLGITLLGQGEKAEAIPHFRAALRLLPSDSAQARQIREFLRQQQPPE